MAEIHENRINALIGRVKAEAVADNYFPLIGNQVAIQAKTKWAQSSQWHTQSSAGDTVTADGALSNQTDNKTVTITGKGELTQRFVARNSLSEVQVQKTIYAMEPAVHPYFDVTMSKEIVRADNEVTEIVVKYEHGYSGANTVQVRVYRENEEATPLHTFNTMVNVLGGKMCTVSFTERGQYDVEVDVTDTATGVMFSKRINKLITVTPKLAPEPADRSTGYRDILAVKAYTTYSGKDKIDFNIRLWENTGQDAHYAELIVPAGEQNGTSWYEAIDVSILPSGTTLVLLDDPDDEPGYARRVLLKGNNPTSVSNASGTPNTSFEKPLIITHNQNTTYHVPFQSYGGWNFDNNMRHIVIDGRGYKNLKKGFHIHKQSPELFAETGMFIVNGTSNFEIFEVEFSDCDFTSMMAKTDPNPDRPWFWFGNWEFENLWLHHCHIHDMHGEGFYYGYFTPETQKSTNSQGQLITYRPHAMTNTLVYRNKFEHCGYDGIQLSNARGAEVCYNELYDMSFRGDKDQCSGMSIQSMSGRCYNNVLRKFQGPGIQIGPLGDIEVFNNVVSGCQQGAPGVYFLFSVDIPEQNTNGSEVNTELKMYIHNNVIESNGTGVNGRNTVQVQGLYFEDNILTYRGSVFGNMKAETLSLWQSQSSGNKLIQQDILNFVEIDRNKIADSANGNYQIAHNSPLIKAGGGSRFKFDFRGYKSWYGTMAPVGAFMGIYKDTAIVDDPISLTSVTINDGAASTTDPKVTVKLSYTGAVTRCRISEVADFSAGSGWMEMPSSKEISYTLGGGFGDRVIYAQVSGGTVISNSRTASIELASIPLSLDSVTLNNGATSSRNMTVTVAFTYSGSFAPVQYRLGETADLADVAWLQTSESINYTFATMGQKRLYAQLKDASSGVSNISSAVITIADVAPIATVSLGWSNTEIGWSTPGLTIFDTSLGVTRFNNQHNIALPRTIYDHYGAVLGTATPSLANVSTITNANTKGAVTGNNSGVYPDVYLEHNSALGGNSVKAMSIDFLIDTPGQYKITLLCNTIAKVVPNDAIYYKAITETEELNFELPAAGVLNNTSAMTKPVTVTVGANKALKIELGITGTVSGYWWAPLNIIKIEQL